MLQAEKDHLAKADRDIAEGTKRIGRQAELVEKLRVSGHDTSEAEILLQTLRQTLQAWTAHRDEIIRQIARLECGALDPARGATGQEG